MVIPFITLDDGTEFVCSDLTPDGRVRIDIERPDAKLCFKTATCWLPNYTWENVSGLTPEEVGELQGIIEPRARQLLEPSQM